MMLIQTWAGGALEFVFAWNDCSPLNDEIQHSCHYLWIYFLFFPIKHENIDMHFRISQKCNPPNKKTLPSFENQHLTRMFGTALTVKSWIEKSWKRNVVAPKGNPESAVVLIGHLISRKPLKMNLLDLKLSWGGAGHLSIIQEEGRVKWPAHGGIDQVDVCRSLKVVLDLP